MLGIVGVLAVGLPAAVAYVRDVVPAHALANAFEWQFSLTSLLTSLGAAAPLAIRCGELMFAAMTALGVAVALRLRTLTGDAAVIVLIPPAFARVRRRARAFPAARDRVSRGAVRVRALSRRCARSPRAVLRSR